MIELVIVSTSMTFMVYLGHYLALEGQFDELSSMEKIVILFFVPLLLSFLMVVFIFHTTIAMILALVQKLIEKLEKVPEKEVERWIVDHLTLFNTFEPKLSLYCLVMMTTL